MWIVCCAVLFTVEVWVQGLIMRSGKLKRNKNKNNDWWWSNKQENTEKANYPSDLKKTGVLL